MESLSGLNILPRYTCSWMFFSSPPPNFSGFAGKAEQPGQYFGPILVLAMAQAVSGYIDNRDFHYGVQLPR
jgi:hypothetical protein